MSLNENNRKYINDREDGINAEKADGNAKAQPADDGFKTGKKSHGLTWENPMEEQAFDDESLSKNPEDEEGN